MVRQIAHILIPPREKRSATFRVFTAETTPEEEAERGLLFGCFVIDYYHHRNEEILDSITEELQSRYYDPDIAVRQPEELLEETLRSLNTTLAQLIENEQIFLNLKHVHAVIGVLRGKSLTFTYLGDFSIYLLHQSIAERQHLIDLLATTESKDEKKSPPITRIFSNLVSGTLRTNDVVFCCTTNLLDHTTKERLQKIITASPPPSALEQVKAIVKTEKGTSGILCFLIRLAPDHETASAQQPQQSLSTLRATEEDARNYLAPSLFRNATHYTKQWLVRVEASLRILLHIAPSAPRREFFMHGVRSVLLVTRLLGRTLLIVKRFGVFAWHVGTDLLKNGGDWRKALTTLKEHSGKGVAPLMQKGKERFRVLSLRQRTLMIAAGALAIVILASTVTLAIQRSRVQRREEYDKKIALVQERITTAEASMLFKDEDRTKAIYGEALTLIETLPQKTNGERATKDRLREKVAKHLEKLRHVIPLATIDVIKDFHDIDPAVEVQSVVMLDNTAYVTHTARPIIYKVNLQNKQTLILDTSGVNVGPIKNLAPEEKDPILYIAFDTAGLATVNLTRQSITQTDITFGEAGTTIDGMGMYNKRLYIVDETHHRVWRHDKKDGGFGNGTSWLKTDLDFSGTRAFAIDGVLWIAKEHEVIRLLQGKQTDWKLGAIDPPGLSIRSVIAKNGSNKLWLLDEGSKRVLAIDKDTGKLLAQYPLPADDIRDFSINEKTGQILLLTKTKLLSLSYEKE